MVTPIRVGKTLLTLSLFLLVWSKSARSSTVLDTQTLIPVVAPRSFPFDFQLKVLCIGDSITVGMGDGNATGSNNGYRLDLYNQLTTAGIDTQFIGTQISGIDNPQPRMEGYGWQTIYSILNHVESDGILSQQPNLILIHAGTNDNNLPQFDNDTATLFTNAPDRLGNMLDYVLDQDPGAVVLVAKLIQNKYNQTQTDDFNAQVPIIVGERSAKGFKAQVVDMSMIGGSELLDALHPTAAGYADMASRWYDAIMSVPVPWWSKSVPSSSETMPLSTATYTTQSTPASSQASVETPLATESPSQLPTSSQTTFGNIPQTATPTQMSWSPRSNAPSSTLWSSWTTVFLLGWAYF